ncbi:conjugal transfer protein TraD [Streptobacillus moniliformis]|uniref:Conjugal transfer protein TraD n=1 Tax=Streptobacillus moniliformis (strain ATCC 14647 / DSM 12112 / NCTC 10651 / 9901) TaxID=519441 RepID=D1AYG8_STRM9|nr:conjugal transfer protein TraD [Streptobacillus moniliformis]ACZ01344.1 hypothetical protein Smon_0877 [Streptobacillus moniliformis DSM 12112]AVL43638.1 hypothetical protein CEP89_07460 [Streptobacillus moniliformis]SQA13497.1 Conjugal transfer protein TraD [Streptobacillus moniliformis]
MKHIEDIAFKLIKENRKNKSDIEKENKKITRKERAHKLIQLGTLFTLLEIDNENHDLLIGLLMSYYSLTEIEKEELKERGKIFRIERAKLLEEEKKKNEGSKK